MIKDKQTNQKSAKSEWKGLNWEMAFTKGFRTISRSKLLNSELT